MWVKLKPLVSIFCYLLITGIISLVSARQRCYYETGNFTENSTYGRNRDLILASLPGNVSANGGFFNATIGQDDSDKVYALGLCRGDSSSNACYSCINSSIHDLIAQCPNQKEAISWAGDPCLVRYSDRSFFGILELDKYSEEGYNVNDIKSNNLTQFYLVWESLMDMVVRKASMGSSRLKYATGEADFTTFLKIYALMQCTPDLSQDDCDSCLRETVGSYERCCHGKQGGYVEMANCWLRWDLYPFYTSNPATNATSLSPAPQPEPVTVSPTSHPVNSTETKGKYYARLDLPIQSATCSHVDTKQRLKEIK